jgi:hypothetical protein
MLFGNLPVGDYAVIPKHASIHGENLVLINAMATDDYHLMDKCVEATHGWELELMSTGKAQP